VSYLLRHLASIILLPFTVTVIVPFWLLQREDARMVGPHIGSLRVFVLVAGIATLVIGLTLFFFTVMSFATKGKGTLAPWDPPRFLVVDGVYRYVRNPMISGVLFVLFAESLLTGSPRVLTWFGLFLLINLVYIPLFEERWLTARFGERYRIYREHVPRWIPRLTSWIPPWDAEAKSGS
jgi:protein-S-isoprenylcysteine O-methyltransferase Ste14